MIMKPKKSLGQNFLIDNNILDLIVNLGDVKKNDILLEIGPGTGNLTKKFSFLVQRDFLYKISLELNLDEFLKYSKQKTNSTINKSILSDSLESLIGAIYIDGGLQAAKKFIKLYTASSYLYVKFFHE